MGKSLLRDRQVHPAEQRYHPYVNTPSPCQRIFEIACVLLILAAVPAWLGGVYSIFITGYGTALGLLGLLTFGTRRHTLSFIVFAILFFIFVIVVIILNAIDPIGKNLPFNDPTYVPANTGASAKRSLYARTDSNNGYCSVLSNCTIDIANLGQLDDGQLRLGYGEGASDTYFHLSNGYLTDFKNRTCYISGSTQLQCNYASQTEEYKEFCTSGGQLTYAGSSEWWECNAGTGGSNVYNTKYYPQCTQIQLRVISNNCTNSTGSYDGNLATGGGALISGNPNNGTDGAYLDPLVGVAGGAFIGSRVYAYIDSGLVLLFTLIAIVAGWFVAKEFRPAPGTLTHSATTSTNMAPAVVPGVYVPAAAAPVAAAPAYVAPAAATGAAAYAVAPATAAAIAAASFANPVQATELSPVATRDLPANTFMAPAPVYAPAAAGAPVYTPAYVAPAAAAAPVSAADAALIGAASFNNPVAASVLPPAQTTALPANTFMAPAPVYTPAVATAPITTGATVIAPALVAPAAVGALSAASFRTADEDSIDQFMTPAPNYTTPLMASVVPGTGATVLRTGSDARTPLLREDTL